MSPLLPQGSGCQFPLTYLPYLHSDNSPYLHLLPPAWVMSTPAGYKLIRVRTTPIPIHPAPSPGHRDPMVGQAAVTGREAACGFGAAEREWDTLSAGQPRPGVLHGQDHVTNRCQGNPPSLQTERGSDPPPSTWAEHLTSKSPICSS